jgi:hypothetical protein
MAGGSEESELAVGLFKEQGCGGVRQSGTKEGDNGEAKERSSRVPAPTYAQLPHHWICRNLLCKNPLGKE